MSGCQLCPHKCGVDRISKFGICKESQKIRISRAAPHMWEEPCISGKNGSGTVFFCGCTLGCVYCQNYLISRNNGECNFPEITPYTLGEIFISLKEKGVHNINLVTPTMFVPQISEALNIAVNMGLNLPVVYNTSGYELPETLDIMGSQINIYLPDFKYMSGETAKKYSHAQDYPIHASTSLDHMVKQIGKAKFTEDGMMKSGVIVRHLLLPGQLSESLTILDYLYSNYGNDIYYSLMSQYTPTAGLDQSLYPELNRKVTTYEYNKLVDHALTLGITNAFIQDGSSAKESFIPDFGQIQF